MGTLVYSFLRASRLGVDGVYCAFIFLPACLTLQLTPLLRFERRRGGPPRVHLHLGHESREPLPAHLHLLHQHPLVVDVRVRDGGDAQSLMERRVGFQNRHVQEPHAGIEAGQFVVRRSERFARLAPVGVEADDDGLVAGFCDDGFVVG